MSAIGIALVLALPGGAPAGQAGGEGGQVQDTQPPAEQSAIERMLEVAREGRPVVRPQAAERLLGMGPDAARRVLELAREDAAALGPELVAVLPRFGGEEHRGLAWNLLADPDFPWRPALVQGLAQEPDGEEARRLVALLADPLAAVRVGALDGVARLGDDVAGEEVRARLADQDGQVRRRAARILVARGEVCAAWWLLAELERGDSFFDLPVGRMARYDAWRMLVETGLGAGIELDPGAEPEAGAEARARVGERIAGRCPERPDLPVSALPGRATEGDVLGLELRSCRRGEYFLRWSRDDRLRVGLGRPAEVQLPPGTVARLLEEARGALEDLDDERFWGQPGCDLERFHLADGDLRETLVLAKGPEAADLRPAVLDRLALALLETLPEGGEDPRLVDLRGRVHAALTVLGGAPERRQ